MRIWKPVFFILILITLISSVSISPIFAQSRETGSIEGAVTSTDGEFLPGVLFSLSSSTVIGISRTTVSNAPGHYRFIGLPPGEYQVTAQMSGFNSQSKSNITVFVGSASLINFTLELANIVEVVDVSAAPPAVDSKSSSTARVDLSNDFLRNIPNHRQFVPEVVNMAPGVDREIAYGAGEGTGISYLVDGVDVSDPDAGTYWVFLDYNAVESMTVSGIGAPAEYGGFSGVIFNTVTKSGSNMFKGYAELFFQDKSWNSKNSSDPNLEAGPLGIYNAHIDIGGPIIKDKLSFFASLLYYRQKETYPGTTYDEDFKQPKFFLKFSWQPSAKTRINTFFTVDAYDGTGREGGALVAENAALDQKSPEFVGNFNLTHLISERTLFEAKIAYFTGYYDLIPTSGDNISGRFDLATNEESDNHFWFYRGERSRLQANTAVTHHADEFLGSHDFKFGAELSHMTARNEFGYTNGRAYFDYAGEPYLAYDYEGYDVNATLTKASIYVQDSWSPTDRLTINPGIRVDFAWGGVTDLPGTEYKPKAAVSPRIGFSYDIFGDYTTALKAHWGRYYESPFMSNFTNLSTSRSARILYLYSEGEYLNFGEVSPGNSSQYLMDSNIKQAYMDQFTVGLERVLFRDLTLGVTYIHRKNHNHIGAVLTNGQYEMIDYFDENTNQTFNVWQLISDPAASSYLITNPQKGDYGVVLETPYREYNAVEILLNKRFSNNWQLLASYVYGKSKGNLDNTFDSKTAAGANPTYENPNLQINSDGNLTGDQTHIFKIQGTAILPYGIHVSANFHAISGRTYTMKTPIPYEIFPDTELLLEPRGSRRYPASTNLDLRLEKNFKIGGHKLGIMLDMFNVFNEGTVVEYNTLAGEGFETVLDIRNPRAFRAGIRWWF